MTHSDPPWLGSLTLLGFMLGICLAFPMRRATIEAPHPAVYAGQLAPHADLIVPAPVDHAFVIVPPLAGCGLGDARYWLVALAGVCDQVTLL